MMVPAKGFEAAIPVEERPRFIALEVLDGREGNAVFEHRTACPPGRARRAARFEKL